MGRFQLSPRVRGPLRALFAGWAAVLVVHVTAAAAAGPRAEARSVLGPSSGTVPSGTVASGTRPSASASAAEPTRDLGALLAALEAGGADERQRAEAELSAALTPAAAPELVRWIGTASAEGRARLSSALARRDAHLGLVLALGSDDDATRAVLRAALDGIVARFDVGLFGAPLTGYGLGLHFERLVRDQAPPLGRLDLAQHPLDVARDLARWGGLPLRLVVDPVLATAPAPVERADLEVVGDWRGLLEGLGALDLTLEGHLLEPESDLDEPRVLFLRVTRRGLEGTATGRELLERWLVRSGESLEAARALASTGWPAAQQLLVERLRATRDPIALRALAWGAETGVFPLGFPTRADANLMLERARADIATGDGTLARDVLEALVALPRTALDGESLFDPQELLDLEAGLERPARLAFELEWIGRARLDLEGVAERLASLVTAAKTPVHLRRSALAAWARVREEPAPVPARAAELVRATEPGADARETLEILGASGAPLPAEWRAGDLTGLGERPSATAFAVALGWCLARGDEAASAAVVARALATSDEARFTSGGVRAALADVIGLVRGRGGDALCAAVLERAAAESVAAAERVEEVRALSGSIGVDEDSRREDLYARAVARRGPTGHGDPELLAALVVGSTGDRARSLLLGEFVGACDEGGGPLDRAARERGERVLEALARAITTRLAAGEDASAQRFASSVQNLARQRVAQAGGTEGAELAARVLSPSWPRPLGWEPTDLARPGPIRRP
ncbi:hypothetical protein Pla163_09560 [Planctomycetes bacterium Pla163]|uniref:Uncharacterized protein n=1 Tax=Rohdeia mirabilis TaxID=2528008 RepID=A0A518CXA2_9BACT|nr:hypothetical protein Pla163_09560 [Planctomycetes bacterium Pla163]